MSVTPIDLNGETTYVFDGNGTFLTQLTALTTAKIGSKAIGPGMSEYKKAADGWVQTSFGGAVGVVSKSEVPVSSVGFGEGAALSISTTDNNTTEGAVIETQGKALHVWTTNACQINIGDSVTAGESDYVLIPNVLYKFPVQSGWRVSVRAIGTSGGSVYYHPVGE